MGNTLKSRGAIRCSSDHRYLTYADGTPFFWLADTWWFGATKRMSKNALKTLLDDRAKKGFTVILLVIGAPPEVDPLGDEAGNEGGCAFLQNGDLNAHYFDHADNVIRKILAAGISPCIVGSWGHHIDQFGVEAMKNLWKEIISRWGELPVIYCLTGEADIGIKDDPASSLNNLCIRMAKKLHVFRIKPIRKLGTLLLSSISFFGAKEIQKSLENRISKWTRVSRYVKSIDKNNRILLVHLHRKYRASVLFHKPDWLDIDSIQSGHTLENAGFLVKSSLDASAECTPYINLEPWYEGILDNFGPEHQRYAFWMSILAGASGHTYGAHGIWQMAQDDNFMGYWGDSDWKTAMNYPGSSQLGKAKQFLGKYSWWTFTARLSAVTPSWDEDNPFRPMAAVDCDSRLWVYCPLVGVKDTHTYQIQMPESYKWAIATWIDPTSMRCIKKQRIAKSFSLMAYAPVDRLLLLEPGA